MADNFGNVISLGERDCSVQRRHQKIIEESPSPVVGFELRKKMGEVACAAAKEINYSGAGTIEFLLDKDMNFYFLEMNTRLQVEHPVTEMVTGLNLVEMQLKVADGQALDLNQDDVVLTGHSIEVRLYAEDPLNRFLPSTGKIEVWRPDNLSDTRYDSGIVEDQLITPFYDPMIAKIISKGKNRKDAINKLRNSLLKTALFGVKNNRDFLISILESDAFNGLEVNTSFLENNKFDDLPTKIKNSEKAIMASLIFVKSQASELINSSLQIEKELLGWSNVKNLKHPVFLEFKDEIIKTDVSFTGLTSFKANSERKEDNITFEENVILMNGKKYSLYFTEIKENTLYVNINGESFKIEKANSSSKSAEEDDPGSILAPMHGVKRK
jgi:geranyl-CoA carboxylase alpha subunit